VQIQSNGAYVGKWRVEKGAIFFCTTIFGPIEWVAACKAAAKIPSTMDTLLPSTQPSYIRVSRLGLTTFDIN
jgi:hypothetical protein